VPRLGRTSAAAGLADFRLALCINRRSKILLAALVSDRWDWNISRRSLPLRLAGQARQIRPVTVTGYQYSACLCPHQSFHWTRRLVSASTPCSHCWARTNPNPDHFHRHDSIRLDSIMMDSHSDTSGPNGTPAPYGRACTNCARAKCRCIYRPGGSDCERYDITHFLATTVPFQHLSPLTSV
jgi:hypothetical protein